MKKSLFALICLALVGAACAPSATPTVESGEGMRLIPEAVDWRGDVGRDSTVLIDAEGQPSIVYLGFKQVLEEGEIADARPLHLAPIANVLQANIEGGKDSPFWNLVAVSWTRLQGQFPVGDELLQPVTEEGVAEEPTPNASTNAAMTEAGVIHAVWTDSEGVKYANDSSGAFVGDTVAIAPEATGASVAVDEGAQPWIAFYDGNAVMLATPGDRGWLVEEIGPANPVTEGNAARTRVAINGDGHPAVAYTDGDSPMLATIDAETFGLDGRELLQAVGSADPVDPIDPVTTQVIEPRGGGFGISLVYDASGAARVAYYTADGAVHLVLDGSAPVEVAAAPTDGAGTVTGWGTGLAVDEGEAGYITWYDLASNSVKMDAHVAGEVTEINVPAGFQGAAPSITTSADGAAVWMSWYDSSAQNLMAAHLTDAEEVTMAAISPSPVVSAAPPPPPKPDCEAPALDLIAPVGSQATGFNTTCLAADAQKPFTINFDNQDVGISHNLAVYENDTSTDALGASEIAAGPIQQTVDMDPLDGAEYFYKCDVHPTTMTGTLVVV